MLECQNCGAVGDSFFSENYFNEMVCELCGTQSFLQARNETQEVEDMGMDVTTVLKTLKRRDVRKRKRHIDKGTIQNEWEAQKKKEAHMKETPQLPELLDCVLATQMVLDSMARALIKRVGSDTFPADEYLKTVKSLWFKFLKTWGTKGTKPLLRCYNEFFLYYTRKEEKSMDPAATFDLLEQWDAEWESKREDGEPKEEVASVKIEEKTDTTRKRVRNPPRRRFDELNMFSIVDLVGILMIASRALNLGLLPSDFAEWVATGVIPYHNSLATCCADAPDVRASVKYIASFFHSLMLRHKASTVQIAYSAHHLQYHMGLRLPPLNVPLAAHRICATMGFPSEVYRNFLWITGFMNVKGPMTELPLLLQSERDGYPRFKLTHTQKDRDRVNAILETDVGIVAHLVVAIKMCANWHEWIYERYQPAEDEESKEQEAGYSAPPVAAVHDAHLLPRSALDSFTQFAKQVFLDPDKSGIPEGLEEHVEQLQRIQSIDKALMSNEDRSTWLKSHDVYAYPAIHVDGILAESDATIESHLKRLRSRDSSNDRTDNEERTLDAFFYPIYNYSQRTPLHSAYEHVLELLCGKINAPIAQVFPLLAELDKRMKSLVYHFERTKCHVDFLQAGQAKWRAAKARLDPIIKASSRSRKADCE